MKRFLVRVLKTLSSIDNDKLLHFFYGTLLALFVSFLVQFGMYRILIVLITLVVAVLKEIYDHFYGSGFSIKDILYTIGSSVILYFLI